VLYTCICAPPYTASTIMPFSRTGAPSSLTSNTSHSTADWLTFGLEHQNVEKEPSCSISGPLTRSSVSTLFPNGSWKVAGAKSSTLLRS
jgi:hypothetical protein